MAVVDVVLEGALGTEAVGALELMCSELKEALFGAFIELVPFGGAVFFEEAIVPYADFIFAIVEVVDGAVVDVEDGVAVGEES